MSRQTVSWRTDHKSVAMIPASNPLTTVVHTGKVREGAFIRQIALELGYRELRPNRRPTGDVGKTFESVRSVKGV